MKKANGQGAGDNALVSKLGVMPVELVGVWGRREVQDKLETPV